MNGMYWGLTAIALANQLDRMDRSEVISFVKACQTECGGMSCSIGHDPHILSTLSAVQVSWASLALKSRRHMWLSDFCVCKQVKSRFLLMIFGHYTESFYAFFMLQKISDLCCHSCVHHHLMHELLLFIIFKESFSRKFPKVIV